MSHRLLILAVATSLFACTAGEPAEDGDLAEDNLTQKAWGANYGIANNLYKEAVAISKDYNKHECIDDASQEAIVEKMKASVDKCEAFRDVYINSKWAAPVREALAGNIEDGLLRGKDPIAALPGSTFYGRRPGAGPESLIIELREGGATTFINWTFDEESDTGLVKSETELTYTITAPSCDAANTSCPLAFVEFSNGDVRKLIRVEEELLLVDEDFDVNVNALSDPSILSNYQDQCSA